jgi:hypothetical protein
MTLTNYGWGILVYIALIFIAGIAVMPLVMKSGKRFIVAGKALPFFFVGTTMMAQSIDAMRQWGTPALWPGWLVGRIQFPLGSLCLVSPACLCRTAEQLNLICCLTSTGGTGRRDSRRVAPS